MDNNLILLIPAILIVTVALLFIFYWWRQNKEIKAGFAVPPIETEWVLIISLIFTIGAYALLKVYLGRQGNRV